MPQEHSFESSVVDYSLFKTHLGLPSISLHGFWMDHQTHTLYLFHSLDLCDRFLNASAFNQDISSWDVSGSSVFSSMFQDASSFNQDLCDWNDHLLSETEEGYEISAMFAGSACYGGAAVTTNEYFEPNHLLTPLCELCTPFQVFETRAELRGVLNIGETDPTFGKYCARTACLLKCSISHRHSP